MSDWPPKKRRVEISSDFYSDPRIIRAGNTAVGLYVLSIMSFSEQYLGERDEYAISRCEVEELSTVRNTLRVAKRLEDEGLWRRLARRRVINGWAVPLTNLWRLVPLREPISPALRAQVITRDSRCCQLCGQPVERGQKLHIDHILPVALGGRSVLDNLQVAHSHCNLRKGARV